MKVVKVACDTNIIISGYLSIENPLSPTRKTESDPIVVRNEAIVDQARKRLKSQEREKANQQEKLPPRVQERVDKILEKFADPKRKRLSADELKARVDRVLEDSDRLIAEGYYFDEETGRIGKHTLEEVGKD